MSDPFKPLVDKIKAPSWNHTIDEISSLADQIIESEKHLYDTLVQVENPTIENFLNPYIELFQHNHFLENQITFYLRVSPDKLVRDASNEAEKKLDKHAIDLKVRVDMYEKFCQLVENVKGLDLHPETSRYLDRVMLDYKRRGLLLPDEQRQLFKTYSIELSELSVEFDLTLRELTEYLLFSEQELDGVPQDVIDQFEVTDSGDFKMTYKYPDLFPVLKYAKNQDTRRKAFLGNQSKSKSNGDVLLKMIRVRYKMAKLLGFNNFSDYKLEDRLAQNLSNVMQFLNDLRSKLGPLGKEELKYLKAFKNKDLQLRGLEPQDEFYQWDMAFYNNLLLEKEYQVDHQKVQEYFPLDSTIEKMFSFYEKIFDIKFYKVPTLPEDVWHEDVKRFAVFQDIRLGKPQFQGFLYLDLHPRQGKYGHAANFGLGPGFERPDGTRQFALAALVCNFTKPLKDKPSLLKHNEVTTFFHELGHGVHSLLARTKYAKFHGTRVPKDFVEAPSQMLEFWTWSANELKTLSSHYKTGEPIDDDLIKQLVNSKNVNNGLQNLRQLHFGFFDMKCHTIDNEADLESLNLLESWNAMRSELTLMSTDGIKTPGYASFGHIAHGYESGYYGYLYSKVFAVDIYYTLFKHDPMNVENGLKYRDIILARGNSRDMMDNLQELLGRQPNSEAFLQEILK